EVALKEREDFSSSARSLFIAIAAWMIPGLGHLVQRRIGRAIAGIAAVGILAVVGLWMRGNVFPARSDDAFSLSLGFAFLSRRRLRSRIRYLIWAFLAFLLVAVAIGWIMYPASHLFLLVYFTV